MTLSWTFAVPSGTVRLFCSSLLLDSKFSCSVIPQPVAVRPVSNPAPWPPAGSTQTASASFPITFPVPSISSQPVWVFTILQIFTVTAFRSYQWVSCFLKLMFFPWLWFAKCSPPIVHCTCSEYRSFRTSFDWLPVPTIQTFVAWVIIIISRNFQRSGIFWERIFPGTIALQIFPLSCSMYLWALCFPSPVRLLFSTKRF